MTTSSMVTPMNIRPMRWKTRMLTFQQYQEFVLLRGKQLLSFLEDVPNPLPYMKHAATLALSSVVEALPTVLIEALAMGLPIVATDCPTGLREILCDGAYGTLVPVGDSAALSDALLRVLRSGRRAPIPEEALARFWYDHIVGKYLALLGIRNSTEVNSGCRTGGAMFEK